MQNILYDNTRSIEKSALTDTKTVTGDVTFKNADNATLILTGTAQVKGQITGAVVKHG